MYFHYCYIYAFELTLSPAATLVRTLMTVKHSQSPALPCEGFIGLAGVMQPPPGLRLLLGRPFHWFFGHEPNVS